MLSAAISCWKQFADTICEKKRFCREKSNQKMKNGKEIDSLHEIHALKVLKY